jgi:glycosyltransferase involved in cell wall biosynthesis
LSLVKAFKSRGWYVRLFLCSWFELPRYQKFKEFFGSGAEPDEVVSLVFPSGPLSYYKRYFFYRSIMRKTVDCDAIVRTYGYPALSRLFNGKYFCYVQSPVSSVPGYCTTTGNLIGRVYRAPFARSFRRSGSNVRFVAVSEFLKDNIESRWKHAARLVIPPPVDVAHYGGLARADPTRRAPCKIVSIGRFARDKNQVEQLEIVARISKDNPAWKLTMIGITYGAESAGLLSELSETIKERGIEKNVSMLLNATQRQIDEELATAQYFLHTNHNEGFGISVVEAAASGCIPVVPNDGGSAEIVSEPLRFASVPDAVSILNRLHRGWRPASVLSKDVNEYSEEVFGQKWTDIIQGEHQKL